MQFGQRETQNQGKKNGLSDGKNVCSFSEGYTQVGEKKKFKAHILKFVGPILKYLRHIFEGTSEKTFAA